jgi:hypothetical protein
MSETQEGRAPDEKPLPEDDQIPKVRIPVDDDETAGEAPSRELPRFATTLAPLEHQVGTHVIAALQHPATVAVLTTVARGPDGHQQVVSIGLDEQRLHQVEQILQQADEQQKQRIPCVGFHCYLDERDSADTQTDKDERGEAADESP